MRIARKKTEYDKLEKFLDKHFVKLPPTPDIYEEAFQLASIYNLCNIGKKQISITDCFNKADKVFYATDNKWPIKGVYLGYNPLFRKQTINDYCGKVGYMYFNNEKQEMETIIFNRKEAIKLMTDPYKRYKDLGILLEKEIAKGWEYWRQSK